jgi:hypothetical protein
MHYFEAFTSKTPNFHRLTDTIFEETGIVISSINLHKIKMQYKNKPFVNEELQRRELAKQAKQKQEPIEPVKTDYASYTPPRKEERRAKTFEELGIVISNPNSEEFRKANKRKFPFKMIDDEE